MDALEVSGGGVDCNACGLSTDLDLDLDLDLAAGGEGAGAGSAAGSGAGSGQQVMGQCAFARAIKAAAATHVHRHQYYAAIVQTSHREDGGDGGGGQQGAEEARDGRDGGEDGVGGDELFNGVVGYEEFLVHRPAGDEWIAGALPPPTSVRRASFGPQLRGELLRLAVQQNGGAAGW